MTPWDTLGVAPDAAVADLRRRYAALIKQFRPETHPQDFVRIREAYEAVLPAARRREQQALETAPHDVGEPLPAAHVDTAPPGGDANATPSIDGETAIGDTAIGVVRDADAATAERVEGEETGLAALFHRFHADAEAAAGMRDEALLPALRALLQARGRATLDDSQALEFALMRWFIEAGMPPLTLLFETGRAFDWHRHPARMSSWLSPWALRQMVARLQLSRDLVYARRFSGNAWLRRLHSPRRVTALLASRPATLDASRWAERWQQASDDADAPQLASALNSQVLKRLQGRELLTTDVWTGVVLAWAARDLADPVLGAVIATAALVALRLFALWLHPAPGRYRLPASISRAIEQTPGALLVGMAAVAALGVALLVTADAGTGSQVAGTVLVLPVLLLLLRLLWDGVSWVERCGAELFAWRGAVDRLEFDRWLARPLAAEQTRAPRWSPWARWKAIPAALRFERVELATRARPGRPILFKRLAALRRKPSAGRLLWFGGWIAFAILRAVLAFHGK